MTLLEKAMAKIQGTFFRNEGDTPRVGLNHLCGVYAKTHHHDREKVEDLWKVYFEGERRNAVMVATSNTTKSFIGDTGIVGMHAYSLLSAHEVTHKGSSLKLMKLRNPWGRQEWNGAWSDKSQEWKDATDDLKKELNFRDADDGIFFMTFEDFLIHFMCVCVSVGYEDRYIHNRAFGDFNKEAYQFFSFVVERTIDLNEETFIIQCA